MPRNLRSLNDDVLFGEVWAREDKLSPRDRSLITVSALMASGILDTSLLHHIERAKANGVTATEMSEALTQLAFYAGMAQSLGGAAGWQKMSMERNKTEQPFCGVPHAGFFGRQNRRGVFCRPADSTRPQGIR